MEYHIIFMPFADMLKVTHLVDGILKKVEIIMPPPGYYFQSQGQISYDVYFDLKSDKVERNIRPFPISLFKN